MENFLWKKQLQRVPLCGPYEATEAEFRESCVVAESKTHHVVWALEVIQRTPSQTNKQ
jgi:hypothetical protein